MPSQILKNNCDDPKFDDIVPPRGLTNSIHNWFAGRPMLVLKGHNKYSEITKPVMLCYYSNNFCYSLYARNNKGSKRALCTLKRHTNLKSSSR